MTAANDLGLTTAVPARIEVLADARLKPIKLGNQEIHFKFAAPSRLYWAGRPAMRVVQALHWMQDMLAQDSERQRVQTALRRLLAGAADGDVRLHGGLKSRHGRNAARRRAWSIVHGAGLGVFSCTAT